jgi:hypothetical protein
MKCSKRFLTLGLILLGLNLFAAEDGPLLWTSSVDWNKAEVVLTIESPVATGGMNLPAGEFSSERKIDQALPGIFLKAVSTILVDSLSRVADYYEKNSYYASELLRIAELGTKGFPRYSRTLNRVSISYTYPLHPLLGALFISHKKAADIPRDIRWSPSARFTGIVITAQKPLPVHGEAYTASVVPCIFPEIFNEDMEPVLLHDMGDPAFLSRWGSAAYSRSFDEESWEARIGRTPLRIVAAGLFGKSPTDLIIRNEDARRILSRPENRRLLAEGRILIITPAD